ncbi:MAG: HTH domain-containing protein, partial [Defluviitaleaceae bacterium]|nr:HTH domain-containing protein [Defluviitaleaceae bacterium]
MQINRLFEIVYILLNKESVTAKELAEKFNVSTRTIYRDVDNLSLAGIPVYTEKGKGGGIFLLPDFVLNKSILSEREQSEILTALHSLSHVMTDETKDVLNRLSTIFNRTATNWLDVDFSDWSYCNDFFND